MMMYYFFSVCHLCVAWDVFRYKVVFLFLTEIDHRPLVEMRIHMPETYTHKIVQQTIVVACSAIMHSFNLQAERLPSG